MRIIVILNSLYTGGAEFSTLSLYGWMIKKGYEIKIVCYKRAQPSFNPTAFGLTNVHYLKGKSFWERLSDLNSMVKEFKPQLVHSVLFEANMLGRLSRMKMRNFVHIESLVNEMYSEFRYADPNVTRFKLSGYRLMDWATQLFGVDHFHANGLTVAKHYTQKLGILQNRITIIPRGRQPNPFVGDASNRERIRLEFATGDRIMIIHVGRHEFQKGQDVLLDAVPFLKDLSDKIQVVLVGREGNFTTAIKDKIKKLAIEKLTVLTGHREDVPALLAAADVFVFPSRFEGLPGALIEAEAAGLPIVCTSIENNLEVVSQGSNALCFHVDEANSLAEALRELIVNQQKREQMGLESLTIFNKKFDSVRSHKKMLLLFQTLMGKT